MTNTALSARHCAACEKECPVLTPRQASDLLQQLKGWTLTSEGKRIRKQWRVKDFAEGLAFFQRIGEVAESEGHHPDLHLTGYRDVAIELWTHAVGGLTENDFILAAKIDDVPVELKTEH
ncbi:MAG TPA: 4a-hydroxytetrahydrobiopterin dehydratase [Pirellulales bacterium]|jgi:4a-hydroxytetrahydrobiopterin dehydratase